MGSKFFRRFTPKMEENPVPTQPDPPGGGWGSAGTPLPPRVANLKKTSDVEANMPASPQCWQLASKRAGEAGSVQDAGRSERARLRCRRWGRRGEGRVGLVGWLGCAERPERHNRRGLACRLPRGTVSRMQRRIRGGAPLVAGALALEHNGGGGADGILSKAPLRVCERGARYALKSPPNMR